MFRLKQCPKCRGDLRIDHDQYGWYEQCIQCGLINDLAIMLKQVRSKPDTEQGLNGLQDCTLDNGSKEAPSSITSRETQILECVAQGLRNKNIAQTLGVSEQTVKNHITSILRKLNTHVRSEAVAVAQEQGLIAST